MHDHPLACNEGCDYIAISGALMPDEMKSQAYLYSFITNDEVPELLGTFLALGGMPRTVLGCMPGTVRRWSPYISQI